MICIVEGCSKPRSQRRLMCSAHYQRKLKYGDPLAGCTAKGALAQWLRENADHCGEQCLLWPFGTNSEGYGILTIDGRRTSASRAMCVLAHGGPPTAADAAHSCGNGHLGCVNPRHLRWASRRENVADAVRAGTASKGSTHAAAIKAAFERVPRSVRREAKRLGCSVEELTKEASAA